MAMIVGMITGEVLGALMRRARMICPYPNGIMPGRQNLNRLTG